MANDTQCQWTPSDACRGNGLNYTYRIMTSKFHLLLSFSNIRIMADISYRVSPQW